MAKMRVYRTFMAGDYSWRTPNESGDDELRWRNEAVSSAWRHPLDLTGWGSGRRVASAGPCFSGGGPSLAVFDL